MGNVWVDYGMSIGFESFIYVFNGMKKTLKQEIKIQYIE